jgi:hypothetical protein
MEVNMKMTSELANDIQIFINKQFNCFEENQSDDSDSDAERDYNSNYITVWFKEANYVELNCHNLEKLKSLKNKLEILSKIYQDNSVKFFYGELYCITLKEDDLTKLINFYLKNTLEYESIEVKGGINNEEQNNINNKNKCIFF